MQRRFDQKLRNNRNTDLRNRFDALQCLTEEKQEKDLNTAWKQIAALYTEISKEKLGFRKRQMNKN